ncbi:MGH1-like glycoside hydrolase domain-containing protein [Vallitalea okinawensis]|uniref:MGH1-like glycoside hydrolase domain-containing protein n=1 Tax=Vallitalea okinawensis TaxID=2078660 RepID=UPI0013006F96|nr:trehalase family glycosidase [Vallitalea okinawensis]
MEKQMIQDVDEVKPSNCKIKLKDYCVKDFRGKINKNKLITQVETVLTHIRDRGVLYQNGKDVVTGYAYGELYDWDLYFEMLFLSYFGISKYCRNGVEMFLDQQHESGFIARTMGNEYPKPRHHFKPFLAQTALLGSRQENDYRWLKGKYYHQLKAYLEYWFWQCDNDKNGLCYWDGSDHSGMDNQKLRLGYDGVMLYEGVDLNCYLVRELLAMSELAGELGYEDDVIAYSSHAKELTIKIDEVFWDEEDGFYYDRNEKTGALNRIKSIAGFMPLWLDGIKPERIERIIKEHLLNPNEFWLEYPVATWSKDEVGYYQEREDGECTWMGATWIPTNYIIVQGLIKHGYQETAKQLAEKTFELVISESSTREYYNGETGVGQGLNPFWGWSSLGYILPFEFEESYSPSELARKDFVRFSDVSIRF